MAHGSPLTIPEQLTMDHGYEVKGLGTHIGTHVLGLGHLLVSRDDSQDLRKNLGKDSDSEEESPEKTAFGAKSKISAMAPAVGFEPTGPPFNTNELAPPCSPIRSPKLRRP